MIMIMQIQDKGPNSNDNAGNDIVYKNYSKYSDKN